MLFIFCLFIHSELIYSMEIDPKHDPNHLIRRGLNNAREPSRDLTVQLKASEPTALHYCEFRRLVVYWLCYP